MKNFYLLIGLILTTGFVRAQTFDYSTSPDIHTELDWDTFGAAEVYFDTNPLGAITYKYQLLGNDMPNGWSYSLCDYTNCYPGIPSNATMTPITLSMAQNGAQGFFKISLHPGTIPAFATVQLYLYDSNDYNVGDTVTFTFNMDDELSADESELSQLEIYPNPAVDQLTIDNIHADNGDIEMYNMLGELVHSLPQGGPTKQYIDVSSFDAGIYVISHLDLNGIRKSSKVTIQ